MNTRRAIRSPLHQGRAKAPAEPSPLSSAIRPSHRAVISPGNLDDDAHAAPRVSLSAPPRLSGLLSVLLGCLGLLVLGYSAPARGATVNIPFLNSDGTPLTTRVTFRPTDSAKVSSGKLYTGAPVYGTPDSGGVVTVTLASGHYDVIAAGTLRFTIYVPTGDGTHGIDEVLSSGAYVVPNDVGLGVTITNNVYIAEATTNTGGKVKIDTAEEDPVVYTKASVDALVASATTNTPYKAAVFGADGVLTVGSASKERAENAAMQRDKVADLLTLDPLQMAPGQLVEVAGRTNAWDGGGGLWRYESGSVEATNEVTLAYADGRLKLIPRSSGITSRQWGLFSGTSNLVSMQRWVDYTAANGLTARLEDGTYGLTNSLVLPSSLKLEGSYNSVFERMGVAATTNSHLYSALKTAPTFNPYISDGGYTNATITATVTNILLSGFRLRTAPGYQSSFGISLFGVENVTLEGLTVDKMTNHWAITLFGKKFRVTGCLIENQGSVYQDGLHILGGEQGLVTGNIFRTGDDAVAFTTAYLGSADISNWTVLGNMVDSTHGHAIRMVVENPSSTQRIRNIVVDDMVGRAGLEKNAIVRIESFSTNVTYPITNISLAHIRVDHGGLSGHGGTPQGAAYGWYIHNADHVRISDAQAGATPYWPFYFKDCGAIDLINCTADGAQYTNLNSTVYAENVDRLTIQGGSYRNLYQVDGDTIWPRGVRHFSMVGTYVENAKTNRAAVTLASTQSGHVSIIGSTMTNSLGYALTSFVNPSEIILVGNKFGSAQGVTWQGGSPPSGAVISANMGLAGGSVQSGTEFALFSASGAYLGSLATRQTRVYLAATNGSVVIAQDNVDGGTKISRLGFQTSQSTNLPVAIAVGQDTGSFPTLSIGGGSGLMAGSRLTDFHIAPSDYAAGTARMRLTTGGLKIQPSGISGNPTAALDIDSTTSGLAPPRVTTAQRDVMSPNDSWIIYNITTSKHQARAGGAWVDMY